ncbi:hypothetical protein [Paenibacillus elgii]|uniref:hypothetical protein n=1 Tax=Paenibacillus elgii TaxID=189691 RepID=UPI000248DAD5|nr:hypothetical protein [Paenibacillus elgii]
MPSIQDIADQINARLNQVVTNTADTAQNTADIRNELVQTNGRLSQIDSRLAFGLANLSQGLFALLQVQLAALGLLDHHRKQNDTIICELENNKDLLGNIMRKLGNQLRMSEKTLESIVRIEGITERVYSSEAADYDRNHELSQKIEKCCPSKPIPEEECPKDCEVPIYREPRLNGQDWEPLPTPPRVNREG